jgi:hypothetical protein
MSKKNKNVIHQPSFRLGELARSDGLEFDSIEKELLRAPNARASWEAGWNQRDVELKQTKRKGKDK